LPDHYDQPEGSASARTICKSAKLKRGRLLAKRIRPIETSG
jgi:hypothetical protein